MAVADMETRELLQLMVRGWKAGEERKKACVVVARRARARRRTTSIGAEGVVVGVEAGMAVARQVEVEVQHLGGTQIF